MPITAGMVSAASGLKNPAGAIALGYRVNLCKNPNIDTNSTGWSALTTTIERSSEQFYSGTHSIKINYGTESGAGTIYGSSDRIPVTSGQQYTFSAYLKTGVANSVSSYRLRVRTYTAVSGGSTISTIASTAVELQPDSDWTRLSFTPALTDPGIQAVILIIDRSTTATTGDVLYVDSVLFEKSSTLKDYFDGNSLGAFWGGAENASISGITPY
jgi:hypothetical protein